MSKLSQTKINVLDKFEARSDDWSFGEFESAIKAAMGSQNINYQDANRVITVADEIGSWPNTVKRYVLTNYKAFGNCPAELNKICGYLLRDMSVAEKESWGFTN